MRALKTHRQFMTDNQKFIATSTRLFSNGWSNVGV